MSDTKKFTTRTASLKATKADIIKLDVKQLNINGEPLKSAITIKDERETITENDIWPNPINAEVEHLTSNTDGNIVYQGLTNNTFDYSEMTDAQKAITSRAVKVIDNKVLGSNDKLLMNWDTKSFTKSDNSSVFSIFNGSQNLTEWISDLSSLTDGSYMFTYCHSLTSFDSDLPSLTNGERMLYGTALTSFNSDLSKLTNGTEMFSGTALESFNSDLSSLTSGERMFNYCYNLESFNSDLSSLTNGTWMFGICSSLTTFNSDLSNLTNGSCMFYNCSNLTSFNGDLSNLTNGRDMFYKCKLDADSLNNIIHTLNDLSDDTNDGSTSWGQIYIGLGYTNTDDSKLAIAKHCCCDSWDELNQEFSDKGWSIKWQFNGSQSASNILNLLDDIETPSTIIWAKLVEVTDEKGHHEYVLEEYPSKHYNIHWYHESNGDNEGYQQFGSLLEAMGYFGLIPKEYSEQ